MQKWNKNLKYLLQQCMYVSVCVFNNALLLIVILQSWGVEIDLQQTKSCIEKSGKYEW